MCRLFHNRPHPSFVAVILLALAAGFGFHGIPARAQEEAQGAIRVSVDFVMVDATVKTKAGKIMTDLKKDDFEVLDNGVPQKLQFCNRNALPLELVLVLDLSDSIGPYLNPLRDAANTVLAALKPDDEVALVTFSDNPELRVPLTKDKAKIAEAFHSFRTGGLTNINDGVYFAADYLRTGAPKGRRAIILISDNVGTDPGEHNTKEILAEADAADVALYSLKVPGDNPKKPLLGSGRLPGVLDLRKIMEQTGGEVFDVQEAVHLDAIFESLMERIKTRYTMGYYAPANSPKGIEHKLDVRLASSFGIKGRNYTVLAKTGYATP
jgi:Ca-activated chloride channel family protein